MRSNGMNAVAAGVLLLLLTGCRQSTITQPPPAAVVASIGSGQLIEDYDGAEVVGTGTYHYRFVLHDTDSGKPAAKRPFALSNSRYDLPFVVENKKVYEGITDERGRTPTFAFTQAIAADSWELRERFGTGPFGEQLVLTSKDDGQPLAGAAYTLVICDQPPRLYRGVSDGKGLTGYAASSVVTDIMLYIGHDIGDGEQPAISDDEMAAKECLSKNNDDE